MWMISLRTSRTLKQGYNKTKNFKRSYNDVNLLKLTKLADLPGIQSSRPTLKWEPDNTPFKKFQSFDLEHLNTNMKKEKRSKKFRHK